MDGVQTRVVARVSIHGDDHADIYYRVGRGERRALAERAAWPPGLWPPAPGDVVGVALRAMPAGTPDHLAVVAATRPGGGGA